MPLILTLPDQYPWVVLAGTSTFFLNAYQYNNVNSARKASGIKYPQLYAEKAEVEKSRSALLFNCAQRAHQNTLESIPYVLFTTMVAGVHYPIVAASCCALWVLGRVAYTIGYSTGDPRKRQTYGGFLSGIAILGIGLTATATAVQMVLEMYK